jgi:putative ABC transport system permease protein
MRMLRQIAAISLINLRSIPQRFWVSLSTVVAVALVVAVLLAFLAMANGFQQTLRGSGSSDVAILLRGGSGSEINSGVSRNQLRLVEEAPGVSRTADGKPLVSAELYVVVDGIKKASQTKANLALRGLGPEGMALRQGVRIVEGRMFEQGAAELVVGRSLLAEFNGFDLGSKVRLANTEFTVVGVFEMGGTVFESELWADVGVVQSQFRRTNFFQSIRAKLDSPERLADLKTYVDADPQLKLDVKSEQRYFADQAAGTGSLIQNLGWPLAILMTIGALAGALNTMYSSVAARTTEIATLRAIGFGSVPTFIGTLAESLLLAAIGGLVGSLLAWLFFDGLTASTFGGSFTQVVFSFSLSPDLVLTGVKLALTVGLIGGFFPAIRATRVPLVAAFGDR